MSFVVFLDVDGVLNTRTTCYLQADILTKDLVMDKYKAGYEITSFSAESFDDSVNGSLRKGDIVDVYAVDPATEMLTLMAENVYVSEVYGNAGKKITEDDGVATSFTVWVTPEGSGKYQYCGCIWWYTDVFEN